MEKILRATWKVLEYQVAHVLQIRHPCTRIALTSEIHWIHQNQGDPKATLSMVHYIFSIRHQQNLRLLWKQVLLSTSINNLFNHISFTVAIKTKYKFQSHTEPASIYVIHFRFLNNTSVAIIFKNLILKMLTIIMESFI